MEAVFCQDNIIESTSEWCKDEDVLILYLDRLCLDNGAKNFVDFRKHSQSAMNNEIMVKIIYTFIEVISWNPVDRYFVDQDGFTKPKVELYIETLLDDNKYIFGWRFYFVKLDPNFSFEVELEYMFSKKREMMRKKIIKEDPFLYTKEKEWINTALAMYSNGGLWKTPESLKANLLKLSDAANPAKGHFFFTISKMYEWMDDLGVMRYNCEYDTNEENKRKYIFKPNTTVHVHHQVLFTQEVMKKSNCMYFQTLDYSIEIQEPPRKYMIIGESKKKTDQTEGIRMYFKRNGFRIQNILNICAMMHGFFMEDPECVTTSIAIDKLMKIQSPFRPMCKMVDSSLSFLGNCVTRHLYFFEFLQGVLCGHQELLFLNIMSLISADVMKDVDLRLHAILTGPPSSGKSFLIQLLKKLMFNNMYEAISVQTKQAMTTDENLSGKIILIDELGSVFTEKSKGDDSVAGNVKEALSSGIITTKMCVVDPETKRRITVTTTTLRRCSHVAGMNPGAYTLDTSLKSRFCIFSFPTYRRRDTVDPVATTYQSNNDPNTKKLTDAYCEEWKILKALATILFAWMRVDMLPPVNVDMALKMLPQIVDFFDSKGLTLDPRDRMKMIMYCKAVCVYEALNRVFFTDEFFKKGTTFFPEQVLVCAPFLVVTREQVWFAVSHIMGSFMDPHTEKVTKYLKRFADDLGESRYPSEKTSSGATITDYNYYSFDVTGGQALRENKDVLKGLSKMITDGICAENNIELSEDNVCDILHSFLGRKMKAKEYNHQGQETDLDMERYIMKIKTGKFNRVFILRKFIEQNLSFLDFIKNTLKQTFVKEDQGKIVLGHSMREQDNMKPYLFHVYEIQEDQNRKSLDEMNEFYLNQKVSFTKEYEFFFDEESASQEDLTTSQEDSTTSQEDSTTSQEDSTTSQEDSTTSQEDSTTSQEEPTQEEPFYVQIAKKRENPSVVKYMYHGTYPTALQFKNSVAPPAVQEQQHVMVCSTIAPTTTTTTTESNFRTMSIE